MSGSIHVTASDVFNRSRGSAEILAELGYSDARIAELKDRGVI